MAGTMLKIDIRRGKILDRLKRDGAVSVSHLASELGATPVTIRSDLDALEKDGYLVRVQGGAVRKLGPVSDAILSTVSTMERVEEKQAIARAAAERIRDGDTLFINSGTTMQIMAAALRGHKNLNIVTNALSVAVEMGNVPTFRVILLGGEINAQYGFTHGNDALEQLSHYQADWAVLTLDGISAAGGMTTYHAEESAINRMMIARSQNTMVAADHTKIGHAGFFRFSGTTTGTLLVTDQKADPDAVAQLRNCGVAVCCAE